MKNLILATLTIFSVSALCAQDGEFRLDRIYKIKPSGMIELRCSDAKVFFAGSKREGVHVKINRKVTARGWSSEAGEFTVEVDESDGNLNIRERQSGSNVTLGYYKEEYTINIEAPESVGVTIRGDDGDYFIKNINGSIAVSVDDADVELSDCRGNEFNLRIDDGDIRMNGGKGALDIQADDADVEIYKANFSSIKANVDDGDLLIETSLDNKGVYRIDAQDGSVALNITSGGGEFDIRHDDTHVSTQGSFKSTHQSEARTSLTLPNGQARVSVNADDASIKLTSRN